jgi:hypothetical protein
MLGRFRLLRAAARTWLARWVVAPGEAWPPLHAVAVVQ